MKPNASKISCEDVLHAFALETSHERSVLERYLRDYPQYAIEIAHLSHELSRATVVPTELSAKDRVAIDEAWKIYSSSVAGGFVNLFISLSVPQLRDISKRLDVPRQIITAFREHKVIVSSIPRRFLKHTAAVLNTAMEQVIAGLTLPLDTSCVRSHKADEKPKAADPVTFEQLLVDAQVPENKRAELMAEDN